MSGAVLSRTLISLIVYMAILPSAHAFQLVTESEAALPDDLMGLKRGLTLGPDIVFVSPSPETGFIRSPLAFTVKFKAHGGAQIDLKSILITYMKIPPIDMTQRLIPFIQPDGVAIDTAELPPGVHRFRIDLRDSEGRKSSAFLSIGVEK